jgi:hypothetical protein
MNINTKRDLIVSGLSEDRNSESQLCGKHYDFGLGPRLLTRDQAAAYCGLSVQGFSDWVRRGRLPGPITGTIRWDLKAIDAALDLASGLSTSAFSSPLDQWRAKRARAS